MKGQATIATIIFCAASVLVLLWIGFGVRDDLREDSAFHGIASERVDLAEDPGDVVYVGVAGSWEHHGLLLQGIRAASEEINTSGGLLGHELVLEVRDDNGTVHQAETIAQEFATNPAIPFVIGHTDPRINRAIAQNYEFYQVLAISPNADLADTANQAYSLFFSNGFSPRQQADAFLDLAQDQGWSHIGLVYADDPAGQQHARLLESMALARQLSVPLSFAYPGPRPGTRDHIKRWRREMDLDVIYLDVASDYAAGLIFTFRILGLDLPVVCVGDPPQGITADNRDNFGTVYVLQVPGPDSWPKPLAACATDNTGLCSNQALLGYETLMLLAQSAERAGTLVPEKVAAALHAITPGRTLTGTSGFDQYNQSLRPDPTFRPLQ